MYLKIPRIRDFKIYSDGFQGTFYQNYWSIIHEEIVGTAEDFLAGVVSPSSINETNIALIPKVYDPGSVSQFRPITLRNFSYKILSKILAYRLEPILTCIITPTQNAFVVGVGVVCNGNGKELEEKKKISI